MPSWCLPSHLKNGGDSFETNLDIISKEKRSNFQACPRLEGEHQRQL